ncbi:TPA: hypothetical protein ACH3X3_012278 [Trebouxia sp. C0006]
MAQGLVLYVVAEEAEAAGSRAPGKVHADMANAHDSLQVRHPGSPGREPSLVDLLACPLPDHTTNCKFVAPCSLHEPDQDGTGVAACYSINIFLTYTKAGVRQHTQQPFLLGCTPTMLGTMMRTGMLNLGHLSPSSVRLLVSTSTISVCIGRQMQEQRYALQLLSLVVGGRA